MGLLAAAYEVMNNAGQSDRTGSGPIPGDVLRPNDSGPVMGGEMKITRDEVEKVSLLARLLLSERELEAMTQQLGRILEYMDLLGEVNTEGVEPMAHAIEVSNVFRQDRVEPGLAREEALANAPHRDEECYLVPAVLGEP